MTRPEVPAVIRRSRIIVILRGLLPTACIELAGALADGGIRAIEVTLNSPEATTAIAGIRAAHGERICVGAGTVLDAAGAEAALAAGAAYLICPHTDPALIATYAARGVPVIPGAYTASEAVAAWNADAAAVKLFPADSLSPAHLRALRAPLPHIPFVPTGGIGAANAGAWIAAGAIAVGVGAGLFRDGEPAAAARALVEAVGHD